jgi:hypothetical protein
MGKTLLRGGKRRIEPVRQNKRLAEQWAPHLVQIADVNERDVAIETERSQDRRLRVLGIESVNLVERSLDGKCTMPIDGRGAAKIVVTLQDQYPVSGAGIERSGGQAAQAGSDYDGVELPGHAHSSAMRDSGTRSRSTTAQMKLRSFLPSAMRCPHHRN